MGYCYAIDGVLLCHFSKHRLILCFEAVFRLYAQEVPMSFSMRPCSSWLLLLAGLTLAACETGGPRVLVKDSQTKEIQCTDRNGQILYTGPYNKESWNGYVVQVDGWTGAFYPKGTCHKMPA